MFSENNNLERWGRAKKNWDHREYIKHLIVAGAALAMIVVATLIGRIAMRILSGTLKGAVGQEASSVNAPLSLEEMETSGQTEEESEVQAEKEAIQAVVGSYENLGTVQVSGYLNVRRTPGPQGGIVDKLQGNSACETVGNEGEWYHVNSDGVDGYISNQCVISSGEARAKALEYVKFRAITIADDLNIRSAPATDDPGDVVAQAPPNERYEAIGQESGWIQTLSGYVSVDYAGVKLAPNKARKMDSKTMTVNRYGNIVISKVNDYLNVRSSLKDEGNANIIGKLPSNVVGEIISTENGWYETKSGNVTGYMMTDPRCTVTGDETRELTAVSTSLIATVNTNRLNVKKEPSTESSTRTWTSKEDRYSITRQMDDWVQIELDTGEEDNDAAYISARDNSVEMRYTLAEAIKLPPLEEKANQQAPLWNKVVNYTLQFVGNWHIWGGTSLTKGTDCSGFTQSMMENFNTSLPRVSRDQANAGRVVKSSEIRPGDLILYTSSGSTVSHVVMYTGNDQVAHMASTRSGIRVSTWNHHNSAKTQSVVD